MKFKTVREGQEAVVYNHLGEGKHIVGPSRVFLFRERLQYLNRHSANPYQYLVVRNNLGFVEHLPGPCELFENPLEHQSVCVLPATKIDANHILVVYRRVKDNSVERRIIQGPTVFVPSAEEWVHQFKWHGDDISEKGHMLAGSKVFEQVPCIGDQFYYNVRDVRTNDDTMITVKLMLFYELDDVIKMLETTHDPIGDMINAVCADVIAFAGRLSFEQFLQQTHKLSSMETFSQLKQRAERIGYTVAKVVYRGYTASQQLQAMQDNAIQSRTQLRLNSDLELQRQRLADYKLQKEEARTQLRQDMELGSLQHKQKLQKGQQEHELQLQHLQHEAKLAEDTKYTIAFLEQARQEQEYEKSRLSGLQGVGVDLTKYLLNEAGAPVSQEIQVMGSSKQKKVASGKPASNAQTTL